MSRNSAKQRITQLKEWLAVNRPTVKTEGSIKRFSKADTYNKR